MEKESKEQKIWISLSETIKTGDYQNVKFEAGFSKMYEDSDNPVELIAQGIDDLRKVFNKKTKKIRRKVNRRDY